MKKQCQTVGGSGWIAVFPVPLESPHPRGHNGAKITQFKATLINIQPCKAKPNKKKKKKKKKTGADVCRLRRFVYRHAGSQIAPHVGVFYYEIRVFFDMKLAVFDMKLAFFRYENRYFYMKSAIFDIFDMKNAFLLVFFLNV
jgi:hypothetical protein